MSLSLKIVLIVLALFVPFCQCTNTLTVTSGGNPINNGDTVDIEEEDDFNFTCTTSMSLADIDLLTDIEVTEGPLGSTRDFYLLNVHRNLTGTEFTCTDNTDSITFTLNVLFAPSYSFSKPVFTRFEGEDFFIDSTVEANPEPSGAIWIRDGVILPNDEDNIDITSTSITITNLQRKDNGTYTITSNNGVGEGSGSFDLIVYYGPELTNGNNGSTIDLTRTEGDTLAINCSVLGGSNPAVDTIVLTLNTDNKITITNQPIYMVTNSVTDANSGIYTCNVSTSVNFATLNYNVTVISPSGISSSTVITTTTTSTTSTTTTSLAFTTTTATPSQTGDGSAAGFTSASFVLILVAAFSVSFA